MYRALIALSSLTVSMSVVLLAHADPPPLPTPQENLSPTQPPPPPEPAAEGASSSSLKMTYEATRIDRPAPAEGSRKSPDDSLLLHGFRLGYGHVLKIGDDDVFGAEVNAVSKLGEDTAEPWEILVTDRVKTAVEKQVEGGYERLDVPVPGTDKAYRFQYASDRLASNKLNEIAQEV